MIGHKMSEPSNDICKLIQDIVFHVKFKTICLKNLTLDKQIAVFEYKHLENILIQCKTYISRVFCRQETKKVLQYAKFSFGKCHDEIVIEDPLKKKQEVDSNYTVNDEDYELFDKQKSTLYQLLSLIPKIGSEFENLGNDHQCQICYVYYVCTIEIIFGESSEESSTCYFWLGHYYQERQFFIKSQNCFQKCI